MKNVQNLLAECEQHEKCLPRKAPQLPSRVFQVGESSKDVRLYESKGELIEYVCLSYCWGGGQAVITTQATIDEHTKSINFSTLPQALQDAVLTTRRLGFLSISG